MKTKSYYSFCIYRNGMWEQSPEYATRKQCFDAALRCTEHLNYQYTRITFTERTAYYDDKGAAQQ